jgi:hypothetical protein
MDDTEVVGDGLLVGGQLLAELGDGLLVGRHLGRGHRAHLPGRVDLELLEHQVVGDDGGLGPQIGDLVGSGRMELRPDGEGGEDDEHGKEEGPDDSTGGSRGVWPRRRGRTGAQHNTPNLRAGQAEIQPGRSPRSVG